MVLGSEISILIFAADTKNTTTEPARHSYFAGISTAVPVATMRPNVSAQLGKHRSVAQQVYRTVRLTVVVHADTAMPFAVSIVTGKIEHSTILSIMSTRYLLPWTISIAL